MLVTSSVASEGKTTLAVNYALSLAQQGVRTLLVDLDLRRPTLAREFGLANEGGVTSFLVGKASLESVIQRVISRICTVPQRLCQSVRNGRLS